MDKRKIATVYFMLGLLGLLLFNYPIINLFRGKVWLGIPAILIYFCGVVVLLSVAGFLLANKTKDVE